MIRHKFKSIITERDGLKLRSKKEAAYYDQLKLLVRSGQVVMFLRQPRFDLPGGMTYSADFLEFWSDGTCRVVDVKGYATKDFVRNKKLVEALYPVTIETP